MMRKAGLLLLLSILVGSPCFGQEWARKMFKDREHDFGTVAHSAKAEYRFVLENIYLEDIHIAGVRSSCGCTTPTVETPLLKTYEKGAVLAHFNTGTFSGQRGATLTVTIDKPFYAEVQLQVRGNIRTDTVLEPGSAQFPSIDQGVAYDQKVVVNHTGQSDWKILDVKSSNPHISVEAVEINRARGQVSYELRVHLDENTPVGYLNDHLMLVTNDSRSTQMPVLVEGRIVPAITVSPASLFMGVVQPGQKVTKQLVVKGKKPFRIMSISCDDQSFQFDTSKDDASKELHLIPVTFMAGSDLGKVTKTIKIKTDTSDAAPELAAYAVVAAAQ